jgi:glucan phosphoethanolaminetransferase (alkaline phosphatase superfamily)
MIGDIIMNELWTVAGPIIIMGIVALVIGIICVVVLYRIPKGLGRDLFRVLSIILVVGGAWGSVYIASYGVLIKDL